MPLASRTSLPDLARYLGDAISDNSDPLARILAVRAANHYDTVHPDTNYGQIALRRIMREDGRQIKSPVSVGREIAAIAFKDARAGQAYREASMALGTILGGRVIVGETLDEESQQVIFTDNIPGSKMRIGTVADHIKLPNNQTMEVDIKGVPYIIIGTWNETQYSNIRLATSSLTMQDT
jgi:hypothetical protein